jgi:hypothetical protein
MLSSFARRLAESDSSQRLKEGFFSSNRWKVDLSRIKQTVFSRAITVARRGA